jgi:hypothetical protein
MYASLQSSTVTAFGMLIVLETAPEMKGCTAAIIRRWLSTESARLPVRPHRLAQSKTARCWGSTLISCGRLGEHICSLGDQRGVQAVA